MNPVETAVAFASDQLGEPYRLGGTGPSSWDCSGLVQAAYAAAGVKLPRTAAQQFAALPHVPVGQIVRGDLVFYGSSALLIHHVVLALGNGTCIAAPHTGDVVKIESLSVFTDTYGAARPVASSSTGVTAPTVQQAGWLPSLPNPLNAPQDVANAAAGLVESALSSAVSGVWSAAQPALIKYGAVGAGLVLAGFGLYRAVARPSQEG